MPRGNAAPKLLAGLLLLAAPSRAAQTASDELAFFADGLEVPRSFHGGAELRF